MKPVSTLLLRHGAGGCRRLRAGLVLFVVALLNLHRAEAGEEIGSVSEAAVKIAFVYNFGKFVEWPAGTFQNATSFNLCTVGDIDEFHVALSDIEGRRLQGLPLHVREVERVTEFNGCHTLLIARSERERVREILQGTQSLHVLTVSDIDDFAETGGVIGLLTRNGRVQFNINARAAKSAGLSPGAELMGLARSVIGQESN